MSVKELIELLQTLPENATIVICDNMFFHDTEVGIDGYNIAICNTKKGIQEEYADAKFDEGYDDSEDDEFVFIIPDTQ